MIAIESIGIIAANSRGNGSKSEPSALGAFFKGALCISRCHDRDVYIVDAENQERETEAIRNLVRAFHLDELLTAFGFERLAFVVVELQKPKLIPDTQGDIDILVGNLGEWPPRPTRLVGIEVKCSYVVDDQLKAAKSSEGKVAGIRNQVGWLERMGLDMVGLLDIIGNEPAYEEDGGFFGAAARSARSYEVAKEVLASRLPPESKAAHLVWSAGSVGGGDESRRGAGTVRLLRRPGRNPLLDANDEGAISRRAKVNENIPKALAHLRRPTHFPVVFIDCRKCSAIHYVDDADCPWNSPPAG